MSRPTDWLLFPAWLVGALAFALVCLLDAGVIRAETTDVAGALHAAAQLHGTDPAPLLALVACESSFDATAAGDYRWRGGRYVPTSRGPAQINDLPGTGLAFHFWALGYTDREDPEQVADYLARVQRGDFRRDGVTLARWSCGRLLGLR